MVTSRNVTAWSYWRVHDNDANVNVREQLLLKDSKGLVNERECA